MKNINLEIGKAVRIKNIYENFLSIARFDKGYYIYFDKKRIGPFLKISLEQFQQFNNDIFLFAVTAEKTYVFRNGIYGLERKDEIDTSDELQKNILNILKKEIPSFENCNYIGEVQIYSLRKYDGEDNLGDGYIRSKIENKHHYIYINQDGKYFAVDLEKEIKSQKDYKKFDTFEEMRIRAILNGIDYNNLAGAYNQYLTNLIMKLSAKGIPYTEILEIFNKLKTLIGVENLKNLNSHIKVRWKKHYNILIKDLVNELQKNDFSRIDRLAQKHTLNIYYDKYRPKQFNRATAKEVEEAIMCIPSIKFLEFTITIDSKELYMMYPDNEITRNILTDEKYYNWHGISAFGIEKPKGYEEVYLTQANKWQKYLKFKRQNPDFIIRT